MKIVYLLLFGGASLALPIVAQASDMSETPTSHVTGFELASGVEYQRGKYGTDQQIETIRIPNSARITTGQFQFSASLPYVRIDAPGNVVGSGGLLSLPIIIDPTKPATRQIRKGIGDLQLGAAYTIPSQSIGLTFSGQMKLPTASRTKGLSTGKVDYTVGAALSKNVGAVTPFVTAGYNILGDPSGFDLRNNFYGRAGATLQMTSSVRGTLSYGYAQSSSPLIADDQQIATSLNTNVSSRLSLGVYGNAGLSEGASDVGLGMQLGFRM